jgi:hypothetical protein
LLSQYQVEINELKVLKKFKLHPKGIPEDFDQRTLERIVAVQNNFVDSYISSAIAQKTVAH